MKQTKDFNNYNGDITTNEKISVIKYKLLRISKKNILKTITIIFWIYMLFSLIFALKEVFSDPNWQLIQYSQIEIIESAILATILTAVRCVFKKF